MNVPAVRNEFGLVPTNMGDAMKLAEIMSSATLVPQALQKKPSDCLMVIQQAIRWQMDPFAVAQECSVIQGKLMHSGKLVAAVINALGNLAERLSYSYDGQGDTRTITVSGRINGEDAPRTVTVKLKDARTQNAMWTKQPDQQLMYHGARVWARRHTPELMLGVYSPEEFDRSAEDIIEDWGERRGAGLIKAATISQPIEEEPPPHTELWTDDPTPPEWQGGKWDALGPVKQAGILCADQGFWKYLDVADERSAVDYVRDRCGIPTRADLATHAEAARIWREIVAEYRAWQREPEVIEQELPPPEGKSAAPVQTPAPASATGAADYIARWANIMQGATNADQLAAKWNAEADERKTIAWPEGEFVKLQRKVKQAIDSMRAPA